MPACVRERGARQGRKASGDGSFCFGGVFIFELKVMLRKLKAHLWFDRLPRGSMGTEFLNKCFGSRGSFDSLGGSDPSVSVLLCGPVFRMSLS